eukprot:m.229860 g.229860  ORF g.229860 m.229860 type:complete len:382 (+) comp18852_c1_seq3:114-1259(+)
MIPPQVYFGPLGYRGADLVEHFQAVPGVNPMPLRVNPASWVLEVLAVLSGKNTASSTVVQENAASVNFKDVFTASAAGEQSKLALDKAAATPRTHDDASSRLPSWTVKFGVVLRRFALAYSRDKEYNIGRLILNIIIGLLFGLLYLDLDTDTASGVQGVVALLVVSNSFAAVGYIQAGAPRFMSYRPSFYREMAAHMYAPFHHAGSQALVEIPCVAVLSLVVVTIMYFMAGLNDSGGVFFHTYFIFVLLGTATTYLGQFLSAALPSDQAVQIANGFCQAMFWMTNGVFNPASQLTEGWSRFINVFPYYHAAAAAAPLQFHNVNETVELSPGVPVTKEEFIESVFEFEYDDRWEETAALFGYCAVFLALSALSYQFVRHARR